MFEIEWKPKAFRQLKKIKDKKMQQEILDSVENLASFPSYSGIKALKNHKYDYRLKVGRYRIFFNIENSLKIVFIQEVKKRNESTY